MTTVIRLMRRDFCNLENHERDAIEEKQVIIFCDGADKTAIAKLKEWIGDQEPIRLYAGYDGNLYPQFFIQISIAP